MVRVQMLRNKGILISTIVILANTTSIHSYPILTSRNLFTRLTLKERTFAGGAGLLSTGVVLISRRYFMGNQMATKDDRLVYGTEEMMKKKAHGTCEHGPQSPLRWGVDEKTADNICCFNRHYAEHSGYFTSKKHSFLTDVDRNEPTTYYDSVTGKPLFIAPKGRTFDEFYEESIDHGWPSFRLEEVVWENVRVLPNGETISVDGTHLGHNLPDRKGPRFCINLVCVAGLPPKE